ncbi:MAG: outer membrane beta-barrel domain-containing protein [Oligoflexia bacterium]|nr:outer membrane beta-barrel domain-containing protein [Oligoflexia bacterium]
MKQLVFAFLFVALSLNVSLVKAETIKFPEEELARESVLPVFDQPEAVKKRLVPMESRFELNPLVGSFLSDPWFNAYPLGAKIAYHFDEIHSVGIFGSYFISQRASEIAAVQELNNGQNIPFARAPYPSFLGLLEYEFTPFYGKISLTKQRVMHLNIGAIVGGGLLGVKSDVASDSSVAISGGITQRFFFTRDIGIKADIRALFYQQEDVVLQTVTKKNTVNIMLTVGAVINFPMLQ